jgi:hypothetical protein
MPDDIKLDDPMALILAELKSLNRTVRMLASHLMEIAEAPPRPTVDAMIPAMHGCQTLWKTDCAQWSRSGGSTCWVRDRRLGMGTDERQIGRGASVLPRIAKRLREQRHRKLPLFCALASN